MATDISKQEMIAEAEDLLEFINSSPTAYHATIRVVAKLLDAGFEELRMHAPWDLELGKGYFVCYNDSTVVAFVLNRSILAEGFRIVASHTDFPTLRVKPCGQTSGAGSTIKLRTETYGGALLYTWFDRPLGLAGRVMMRSSSPLHPETILFRSKYYEPVGVIPSVAIHFNRSVNDNFAVNKQVDMQLLVGSGDSLRQSDCIKELIARERDIDPADILDYDLYAYDANPGRIAGYNNSLIVAPRQDNLTMGYESLRAFLSAEGETSRMFVAFDNEEVGSSTKQGADSQLLADILYRIAGNFGCGVQDSQRIIYNSFLVSADMAHAVHPNHPEYHDPSLAPCLNGGPVIKYNAAQKYMTDADGAAVFREVCDLAGVPCQSFANRSDLAGGSTLGNILTRHLPLRGVDVGNPLLAMHSVAETGGVADGLYMFRALREFYSIE